MDSLDSTVFEVVAKARGHFCGAAKMGYEFCVLMHADIKRFV